MRTVFLDTVGLLGLWDRADPWHEAAKQSFACLRAERASLCTTDWVLAECANGVARSTFRANVRRFRQEYFHAGQIIPVDDEDLENAWIRFGMGRVGGPGLIDLLSMVVMSREGIRRVFTNDRHFAEAGFETLF